MKDSGFYIFQKTVAGKAWKLVVNAGQPGPKYIPGHAHCGAMSYELFCEGKPVAVNCGTYAYQCKERSFFRSTAAHNTVMIEGTEQSQCWGSFRLAKRSSTRVLNITDSSITMEMTDQKGQNVRRTITLTDGGLVVNDSAEGKKLLSYVHLVREFSVAVDAGNAETYIDPYSEDYGKKTTIHSYELCSENHVQYCVEPDEQEIVANRVVEAEQYKGYKPLAFLNGKIYFYRSGKLWTVRNGGIKLVTDIIDGSWKDKNRTLIRLFRREPKFAIPINKHRLLLAGYRKILLVDINVKEVKEIYTSRDGFSDPLNICKAEKKWIVVWGDYGPNPNHDAINIYGLNPDLTIETIYSFMPGQIRHVHNIIPKNDGGYYILTGDQEENAGIYVADVDFKSVSPISIGKQQYRAVIGFDTAEGLLYATDAVNEPNYVYILKGKEPEKVCDLNGSCIYGTEIKGAYYFATTVEPDENNRGITSWISRKRGAGILSNDVTLVKLDRCMKAEEVMRYRKDSWPMKLMQYGSIQFPHGESEKMWIYPVAVKKYDGAAIRMEVGHE